MSDDKKSPFGELFSAVDTVVAATNQLIVLGGALANVLDLDAGAVVNAVTENSMAIKANMDAAVKATAQADKFINSMDPKYVAESAKSAVGSIVGPVQGELSESVDAIAKSALTSQLGSKLPIGRFVSLMDSTPPAASFGYEPVASVVADVQKFFGKDSDFSVALGDMSDLLADAAPIAIPFISAIIDGITDQFAAVAANDQRIVTEANALIQRLSAQRTARREPKFSLKLTSKMRVDGRMYASSADAKARDAILLASLFEFGSGGKKPKVSDARKYGGNYSETTLGGIELQALQNVVSQTTEATWAVRKRVAYEFYELRAREADMLAGGSGKLYATVDGHRALEYAKDMALIKLVRDGHVSSKEAQFAFGFGAPGPYDADASDRALIYAATAPGASLWAHWNELAIKRPNLYSIRVAKLAQRRIDLRAISGRLADRTSTPDVGNIIKKHPVAAAGAAGAVLGGLYSLLKR